MVRRKKSKPIKIEMTKEVGAMLLVFAGILVIAFPSLLSWIVGLFLISKGILEFL